MQIKMKETTPVSTTGLNKLDWVKGEIYEASEDLARNLVKGGLAILKAGKKLPKEVQEVIPEETPETPKAKTKKK